MSNLMKDDAPRISAPLSRNARIASTPSSSANLSFERSNTKRPSIGSHASDSCVIAGPVSRPETCKTTSGPSDSMSIRISIAIYRGANYVPHGYGDTARGTNLLIKVRIQSWSRGSLKKQWHLDGRNNGPHLPIFRQMRMPFRPNRLCFQYGQAKHRG